MVVGGGVEHLATMSNSHASCFRVALSWVELSWVTLGVDKNFIKIGSLTFDILLTLSFCGVVVCKVFFVSNPTKVMLGWVGCGWVGVLTINWHLALFDLV